MTDVLRPNSGIHNGQSFRARLLQAAWLFAVLVIIVFAVYLRTLYTTTADTSWLITVAEKYLAGQRLYLDIMETNPPATIFLYMPAVLLARVMPWTAETIVTGLVFLAIAASLSLTYVLVRLSDEAPRILNLPVAAATLFILAIMPGESFTQREQIATICILPWLALALLRLEGVKPPLMLALLTGVAGGVIFCIKPVFVAPFAAVFARVMWRRPSFAYIIAPEHLTGGVISLAYLAVSYFIFPEFWRTMFPLLEAVYIPSRGIQFGWQLTALWAMVIAMIIILRPRAIWNEATGILVCASTGFALACIWQAKYWTYHFYPMMALAFIASLIVGLAAAEQERVSHEGKAMPFMALFRCFAPAILALFVASRLWPVYWPQEDFRPLADAIKRAAASPAVLNLSDEIYVGHPAVRMAGARWVGTLHSNWIHRNIENLRRQGISGASFETGAAAARRLNLDVYRSDLRTRNPNVILTSAADLAWARTDAEMARHLEFFEAVSTIPLPWLQVDVIVMARRMSGAD